MTQTIGELSTVRPHSVKVFQRHGIDFCCGGGVTLADACSRRSLDEQGVLAEIAAEEARATAPVRRWDQAPVVDLVGHLLAHHHAPLRDELARIEAMAERVVLVHGAKDDRLEELRDVVIALRADLVAHLPVEEQVLFPAILRGDANSAAGSLAGLRDEHVAVGALLARTRDLTDGYTVPIGACRTWTALWHGLAELERDLHEHIALENNILFPRAIT